MWRNLWNKHSRLITFGLILVALGIRLYLSILPAQYYDISTYEAWGRIMIARGPNNFFSSTWSDYLPLPIYLCSGIVLLSDFFKSNYGLVFKLTVSFIELVLLFFIWRNTKSQKLNLLWPLLFLSPALLGDSAWWGQLDTIPSLLTVLSLLLLSAKGNKSKLIFSSVLFGLAVAFKPIMLVTLPIFLVLLLNNKDRVSRFLSFGLISFAIFLLPALPTGDNPFSFLLNKTLEQSSTYPYTTINAWNLWSILPLHNSWPPDNQTILSISAHNLGLLIFGALALYSFTYWRKLKFDKKYIFRIAGTILVIFYVFTTRMHERHLLFGLPFLAVAALTDTWLIFPLAILTLTFSANLWAAYYWVNHNQSWPVSEVFIQALSWINVVTALSLVFISNWQTVLTQIKTWLKNNKIFFLILVLASFLRLYHLGFPSTYIFDEVYHSFTAKEYIHNNIAAWEWWTTPPPGVAYEWTHPPLAKYGMVAGMLLFGENSFGWRFGSAIMGVLCIIGIYYLVLSLFQKKNIALLAAFLVSIEGLHISQSRIGMNDMYMLCLLVWSLYNAVKGRWKLAATLYGLSLASKWSALYGVVPLGLLYLRTNKFELNPRSILLQFFQIIRLLLITAIVYVLTFTPFLTAGHTWEQWWELHRQMWYYHTHLVATHAYQSTPFQWLFVLRPVWYFVDYGAKIRNIYAQGNPAILWLGLAAFLVSLPKIRKFSYFFFIVCYVIFTAPWVASPRIMFFYHYLPSATFLTVILAAWINEQPKRTQKLILTLCLLVFILLSPVFYGIAMPSTYWNTLFGIFPSWK